MAEERRRMGGRCVALFRGINVGKAKRVGMADLRAVLESLGCGDVRTLLNSGNAVFTVQTKDIGHAAARIEDAVAARLGVRSRVTVLTRSEVAESIRNNPFADVATNPARLLILVPRDCSARATLKPLLQQDWEPERCAIGRRVVYLWCANGISSSALWAEANRLVGEGGTSRNMATMTKLLSLCDR